eukprot:8738191-Pyramimonas_sp.AAC.1
MANAIDAVCIEDDIELAPRRVVRLRFKRGLETILVEAPDLYQKIPSSPAIGPRQRPPDYGVLIQDLRACLQDRKDSRGVVWSTAGGSEDHVNGIALLDNIYDRWLPLVQELYQATQASPRVPGKELGTAMTTCLMPLAELFTCTYYPQKLPERAMLGGVRRFRERAWRYDGGKGYSKPA